MAGGLEQGGDRLATLHLVTATQGLDARGRPARGCQGGLPEFVSREGQAWDC